MLPAQGAFGDVPEVCPPDWKYEISASYSSQTLYDLSPSPADIFVIGRIYPYLACPHCQGLHRASYWHSPDWDETGTVRTCPHCNEVRDTELVYEVLPHDVLWECCRQNMMRKQEEERAKWDREFARLYAQQAAPARPCANAYE
jgi:glutaredoxin